MKISKRHHIKLFYSGSLTYFYLFLGLIRSLFLQPVTILIEEGKSALQLVRSQGMFWIFSLILIALIYKLKLNFLRKERLLFIVMFVELILLVLARLIGTPVNGAYGWISVGPLDYSAS